MVGGSWRWACALARPETLRRTKRHALLLGPSPPRQENVTDRWVPSCGCFRARHMYRGSRSEVPSFAPPGPIKEQKASKYSMANR